jgi:hypothetical protein
VGDPKPARNPAGAGTGVTFHPWVWPRADLGGCRGCGRGRVFVKPARTRPVAIPMMDPPKTGPSVS